MSSVNAPLVLNPAQHSWLLFLSSFAAKAASGDLVALRAAWLALPALSVRQQWGGANASATQALAQTEQAALEVLASLLPVFVGVPRAIEALTTCHEARSPLSPPRLVQTMSCRGGNVGSGSSLPAPPATAGLWAAQLQRDPAWGRPTLSLSLVLPVPCPSCADPDPSALRRAISRQTLATLYTSQAEPLERNLVRLHPRLHHFIWHTGYGLCMSTPLLVLPEISAVAVGVLSGTNTPRQFVSHARGALNVGLSEEFIGELLEHSFEHVWGDEGIYMQAKELWRNLLRARRRKAAAATAGGGGEGKVVVDEASERAEEAFQDQVARSKRMAAQGVQHPLFSAGQMLGGGDVDQEEDDDDDDNGNGKPKGKNATAAREMARRATQQPARPPAQQQQREGGGQRDAPRSSKPTEDDTDDDGSAAEPAQPSDEEVATSMRAMMRARARAAAADSAARRARGLAPSPSDLEDRWPVPPHVLDPSGMGGAGMASMGIGMGMGHSHAAGGGGGGAGLGMGGLGMSDESMMMGGGGGGLLGSGGMGFGGPPPAARGGGPLRRSML